MSVCVGAVCGYHNQCRMPCHVVPMSPCWRLSVGVPCEASGCESLGACLVSCVHDETSHIIHILNHEHTLIHYICIN
jgi:hypothetical protein